MFVSHTSKGGSGAINGPPATGLEPTGLQCPPRYKNRGEEEAAGEWRNVKEREGDRGNEWGVGAVPGPFLDPFCCCWQRVGEGQTAGEKDKG